MARSLKGTMPQLPPTVTFAPVSTNDFDELATLRIAAMRDSLEHLGRFNPERARERLRKSFHPEHTQFILLNSQRIGFYTFRSANDRFHLDHFYIHPDHQSRGIGSHVMHHLLSQSDALKLPVQPLLRFIGALIRREQFQTLPNRSSPVIFTQPRAAGAA
jgi:ribosomal protein S18 acetylase RimI-like enzyme